MNIFVLCATSTGVNTLKLLASRLPIAGVIGLTEREATPAISGYLDMATACQALGVPFHPVKSYALSEESDAAQLKALPIDVLIVSGWQRLLPPWLIAHAKVGCIGGHGSPGGISAGRGRSPQNWALIGGADQFEISIFFIEPGIDSGPVIATRAFPLTAQDDIMSSYIKVSLCVADMIVDAVQSGSIAMRRAEPQPDGANYLPQRLPDDGAIDWTRSAHDIARFVAALTRPYPGAFSAINGQRAAIWRARPLAMPATCQAPGRLVLCAAEGHLVVETGGGLLLIDDYDCRRALLEAGMIFESVDFSAQTRAIIERHRTRFPELPVADLVTSLVK